MSRSYTTSPNRSLYSPSSEPVSKFDDSYSSRVWKRRSDVLTPGEKFQIPGRPELSVPTVQSFQARTIQRPLDEEAQFELRTHITKLLIHADALARISQRLEDNQAAQITQLGDGLISAIRGIFTHERDWIFRIVAQRYGFDLSEEVDEVESYMSTWVKLTESKEPSTQDAFSRVGAVVDERALRILATEMHAFAQNCLGLLQVISPEVTENIKLILPYPERYSTQELEKKEAEQIPPLKSIPEFSQSISLPEKERAIKSLTEYLTAWKELYELVQRSPKDNFPLPNTKRFRHEKYEPILRSICRKAGVPYIRLSRHQTELFSIDQRKLERGKPRMASPLPGVYHANESQINAAVRAIDHFLQT